MSVRRAFRCAITALSLAAAAAASAAPFTVVQTASFAFDADFTSARLGSGGNGGHEQHRHDIVFTALAPAAATLSDHGQGYRLSSVSVAVDSTAYLTWGLGATDFGAFVDAGTNARYRAIGTLGIDLPAYHRGESLQYYYEQWTDAVWVPWTSQGPTANHNSVAAEHSRTITLHDVVQWSDPYIVSRFSGPVVELSVMLWSEAWALRASDGDDANQSYLGRNSWLGTLSATYGYEPVAAPAPEPASLALVATALGCLGWRLRRRAR